MIEGFFDSEWMYFPSKKLRMSIHAALVRGKISNMKQDGIHYRHYDSADLEFISRMYDANVIASCMLPGISGKYLFQVKSLKSIEPFEFKESRKRHYRPETESINPKDVVEVFGLA